MPFILGFIIADCITMLVNNRYASVFLVLFSVGCLFFHKKIPNSECLGKGISLFIGGIIVGSCWAGFHRFYSESQKIPNALLNRPISVVGIVKTTALNRHQPLKFLVVSTFIDGHPLKRNLFLKGYGIRDQPRVGEIWQFKAQLRSFRSRYRRYGQAAASGRIIGSFSKGEHKRLSITQHFIFNRYQEKLGWRLSAVLASSRVKGIMAGLLLGLRNQMTIKQWRVLRRTGTSHLMAISGLHIGLVGSFVFVCIRYLGSYLTSRWITKIPTQHIAGIISLAICWVYALLVGLSTATLRAVLMMSIGGIATLVSRRINSWRVWTISALAVLLIMPFSALKAGFWLSFSAVAILMMGFSDRLEQVGYIKSLIWAEGLMTVGLVPLNILFFHQFSLVSLLANSIAIPGVTGLVLPLGLLGLILLYINPTIGGWFLKISNFLMEWIYSMLSGISHFSMASITFHFDSEWSFGTCILGTIILLACVI